MRNIATCRYHPARPANKKCSVCNFGLCKYCGQRIDGEVRCNDCVSVDRKKYNF